MKTYIETILGNLDLIEGVTADYSRGRHRNIPDEETERKSYEALMKAIDLIDDLNEAINSKHLKTLEDFAKCCIAYIDENGKCKGYKVSRWDESIFDKCKECPKFEGYKEEYSKEYRKIRAEVINWP